MKKQMLLVFLLVSFNAFTAPKFMVCPNVTVDAQTIINKINTLEGQVLSGPECACITDSLSSVSNVIASEQWQTIRSKVFSGKAAELEGEEIEELKALVQTASLGLSSTISSLGSKRKCVSNKDRAGFLTNVSSVVSEVSNIVGNVSGPYGIAVNVGGELLASAVSGIENLFNKNHYNFKDIEQEQLFMNQYCSYAEIQKDINDYFTLETRVEEFEKLEAYLKVKINDLEVNCPECNGFSIAWQAREKANRILRSMNQGMNYVELGNDMNSKNYNRCSQIHQTFHTEDSDFKKFMELIANYHNPMSSKSDLDLIKDLTDMSTTISTRYPKLVECNSFEEEEINKISRKFNSFMRDLVRPLSDTLFTKHMDKLQFVANEVKYKSDLGNYIQKSLDRLKWIKAERTEVLRKLRQENRLLSHSPVIGSSTEINQRLTQNVMPRYLNFVVKKNKRTLKNIKKYFAEYKQQKRADQNRDDQRVVLSLKKKTFIALTKGLSEAEAIIRYCDYDKYMLNSTHKKDQKCSGYINKLQADFSSLAKLDEKIKSKIDKANLFQRTGSTLYQTNRINEYSQRVDEWNKRGKERWCLRAHLYSASQGVPEYCKIKVITPE